MNHRALAVEVSDSLDRIDVLVPRPFQLPAEAAAGDCYASLVELLCEARRKENGGIVTAFAAVSAGDPVSNVVQAVAWELALRTEERILLATAAGFTHAARAIIRDDGGESQAQIYRIDDPGGRRLSHAQGNGLEALRLRFGFVLVSCPPLQIAPLHGILKLADHAVLVAVAGKTTYPEVVWAQNSIAGTSEKLLGWVLSHGAGPHR